jgi:hypothetical protein
MTSDGRFMIVKAHDWNPEHICELDANARLIAAAPEMLAALKLALAALETPGDLTIEEVLEVVEDCCAAIEKAEGGKP